MEAFEGGTHISPFMGGHTLFWGGAILPNTNYQIKTPTHPYNAVEQIGVLLKIMYMWEGGIQILLIIWQVCPDSANQISLAISF